MEGFRGDGRTIAFSRRPASYSSHCLRLAPNAETDSAPNATPSVDIRRKLLEKKGDLRHNTRVAVLVREWDTVEGRILALGTRGARAAAGNLRVAATAAVAATGFAAAAGGGASGAGTARSTAGGGGGGGGGGSGPNTGVGADAKELLAAVAGDAKGAAHGTRLLGKALEARKKGVMLVAEGEAGRGWGRAGEGRGQGGQGTGRAGDREGRGQGQGGQGTGHRGQGTGSRGQTRACLYGGSTVLPSPNTLSSPQRHPSPSSHPPATAPSLPAGNDADLNKQLTVDHALAHVAATDRVIQVSGWERGAEGAGGSEGAGEQGSSLSAVVLQLRRDVTARGPRLASRCHWLHTCRAAHPPGHLSCRPFTPRLQGNREPVPGEVKAAVAACYLEHKAAAYTALNGVIWLVRVGGGAG